jgi:hypothetical protein
MGKKVGALHATPLLLLILQTIVDGIDIDYSGFVLLFAKPSPQAPAFFYITTQHDQQ